MAVLNVQISARIDAVATVAITVTDPDDEQEVETAIIEATARLHANDYDLLDAVTVESWAIDSADRKR